MVNSKSKPKLLISVIISLVFCMAIVGGFLFLNQKDDNFSTNGIVAEEIDTSGTTETTTDGETTDTSTDGTIGDTSTDIEAINDNWIDNATGVENADSNTTIITTSKQLADFMKAVNNNLNTETKFNATINTEELDMSGKIWTPIGNSYHKYKGTFDGNGCTIKGLTINSTISSSFLGLFGYTDDAVIKSVVLEGVNITTTASSAHVGGIVGYATNSTKIIDCGTYGNISGGSVTGKIAGTMNGGTIIQSYSEMNIPKNYGLAYCQGNVTISKCYSNGSGDVIAEGNFSATDYYVNNAQITRVDDESLWFGDKKKLKGVGNIYIDYTINGGSATTLLDDFYMIDKNSSFPNNKNTITTPQNTTAVLYQVKRNGDLNFPNCCSSMKLGNNSFNFSTDTELSNRPYQTSLILCKTGNSTLSQIKMEKTNKAPAYLELCYFNQGYYSINVETEGVWQSFDAKIYRYDDSSESTKNIYNNHLTMSVEAYESKYTGFYQVTGTGTRSKLTQIKSDTTTQIAKGEYYICYGTQYKLVLNETSSGYLSGLKTIVNGSSKQETAKACLLSAWNVNDRGNKWELWSSVGSFFTCSGNVSLTNTIKNVGTVTVYSTNSVTNKISQETKTTPNKESYTFKSVYYEKINEKCKPTNLSWVNFQIVDVYCDDNNSIFYQSNSITDEKWKAGAENNLMINWGSMNEQVGFKRYIGSGETDDDKKYFNIETSTMTINNNKTTFFQSTVNMYNAVNDTKTGMKLTPMQIDLSIQFGYYLESFSINGSKIDVVNDAKSYVPFDKVSSIISNVNYTYSFKVNNIGGQQILTLTLDHFVNMNSFYLTIQAYTYDINVVDVVKDTGVYGDNGRGYFYQDNKEIAITNEGKTYGSISIDNTFTVDGIFARKGYTIKGMPTVQFVYDGDKVNVLGAQSGSAFTLEKGNIFNDQNQKTLSYIVIEVLFTPNSQQFNVQVGKVDGNNVSDKKDTYTNTNYIESYKNLTSNGETGLSYVGTIYSTDHKDSTGQFITTLTIQTKMGVVASGNIATVVTQTKKESLYGDISSGKQYSIEITPTTENGKSTITIDISNFCCNDGEIVTIFIDLDLKKIPISMKIQDIGRITDTINLTDGQKDILSKLTIESYIYVDDYKIYVYVRKDSLGFSIEFAKGKDGYEKRKTALIAQGEELYDNGSNYYPLTINDAGKIFYAWRTQKSSTITTDSIIKTLGITLTNNCYSIEYLSRGYISYLQLVKSDGSKENLIFGEPVSIYSGEKIIITKSGVKDVDVVPNPLYGYTNKNENDQTIWYVGESISNGLLNANWITFANNETIITLPDEKLNMELHICPVFKPKEYDLKFVALLDGQEGTIGTQQTSIIGNPSSKWVYGDNLTNISNYPTVSVASGNYVFYGWENDNSNYIYTTCENPYMNSFGNNSLISLQYTRDTFTQKIEYRQMTADLDKDTVKEFTLYAKFIPATIYLNLMDDTNFVEQIKMEYGTSDISSVGFVSVLRKGMTFKSWTLNGQDFAVLKENTFTKSEFVLGSQGAVTSPLNLYSSFTPNVYTITLKSNKGQFGNGISGDSVQLRVDYGSNIYNAYDAFPTNPTFVINNSGINFAFAYYTNYDNLKIYSGDSSQNDNYLIADNSVVYAVYSIVDAELSTIVEMDGVEHNPNWVYDANVHDITTNIANNTDSLLSLVLKITYSWQRKGVSSFTALSSYGDCYNVKNCIDSGVYRCKYTITGNSDNSMNPIINSYENTSSEIEIKISQAELYFAEVGSEEKLKVVSKQYDATSALPLDVITGGVLGDDKITLTGSYHSANVGNNIVLDINKTVVSGDTRADNYIYLGDTKGEITKYIVEFTVGGSIYQIGTTTKQLSATFTMEGVKSPTNGFIINVNDKTKAFFTANGISLTATITTNKNEIGIYTYTSGINTLSLSDFAVSKNNVQDDINYTYTIVGQYEIISGVDAITVSLTAVCDDKGSLKIVNDTVAIITTTSKVDAMINNGTSSVSFIASKAYFAVNSSFDLTLNIKNANYWLREWKVVIDGKEVASTYDTNTVISFTISDTNIKGVEIYAYVTRLGDVEFNYNLNTEKNEVVDAKYPTNTKFSYNQIISESMSEYNSLMPTVSEMVNSRNGWTFVKWTYNSLTVDENTRWTYKTKVVLTAVWELSPISLDQTNIKISQVYSGKYYNANFVIKNKNDLSIAYSYSWSTTAKTAGEYDKSSLRVKDVYSSGVYTLKITATGNGQSVETTAKVDVNITPYVVLDKMYDFSKQYDKSKSTAKSPLAGPNGEVVYIAGQFLGVDAGSKIDKTEANWTISTDSNLVAVSNYKINFNYIDAQSQITPREIDLSIGQVKKYYDGTALTKIGNYTDKLVSAITFSYLLTTNDIHAKEYLINEITIALTGEKLSNIDISLGGTMIIEKAILKDDIEWDGAKIVSYDGNSHSISPILESYLNKYVITYNDVTVENGVVNAGTYTVKVSLAQTDYTDIEISGFKVYTTTLTIEQRAIYVNYSGSETYNKDYDGTKDVKETLSLKIAIDKSFTTLLNGVIANYEQNKPTITYTFLDANANAANKIALTLSEDFEGNKNYTLTNSTIDGKINKLGIELIINTFKQYNATTNWTINFNDKNIAGTNNAIIAKTLISGESLAGYIILLGASQVKNYTYESEDKLELKLTVNDVSLKQNYYISNYTITANIIKADILVTAQNDVKYKYTGLEVDLSKAYVISRLDNQLKVPTSLNITYETITDGTVLNDNKAVQVGKYYFVYSLLEEDIASYQLINADKTKIDSGKYSFEIIPKLLNIEFHKTYAYTGLKAKLTSQDNIQIATGLISGDNLVYDFETADIKIGSYFIQDENQINYSVQVMHGTDDYTKNYEIYYIQDSYLAITKANIDYGNLEVLNSGDYYDNTVKNLSIKVNEGSSSFVLTFGTESENGQILNVVRTQNKTKVSILDTGDILYAGTYEFAVQLTNYNIVNGVNFNFVIKVRNIKVDGSLIDTQRIYDGTDNYTKEITTYQTDDNGVKILDKTNNQINGIVDDIIIIKGTYQNKNAEQNKKITFLLSGDSVVLNSYNLIAQNLNGEIKQKPLTFSFYTENNIYTTYYNGSFVTVICGNIKVEGLVNDEILGGDIVAKVINVGRYDIKADSVEIIYNLYAKYGENTTPISNYVFDSSSFDGIIVIKKAQVNIDLTNNSVVYNAKEQVPVFVYSNNDGFGEIKDESLLKKDIQYTYYINDTKIDGKPVNAGVYKIVAKIVSDSNYVLMELNGENSTITIVKEFTISKREISVLYKDEIIKEYTGSVIVVNVSNANVVDPTSGMGGLVLGQTFSTTLTTKDKVGGRYSLNGATNDQAMQTTNQLIAGKFTVVDENGDDVSANYALGTYTATVVIMSKIGNIDTTYIDSLIYSSQDKVVANEIKIVINLDGNDITIIMGQDNEYAKLSGLSYLVNPSYTETTVARNAGVYRMTLDLLGEFATNIEGKTIDFSINQKDITSVTAEFNKKYDGNSFTKAITSSDVFAGDDLEIIGHYIQSKAYVANVGVYSIEFTLEGTEKNNYRLALQDTTGAIVKQEVVLKLKNDVVKYYTGNSQNIDINLFECLNADTNEVIDDFISKFTGSILVKVVDAGEYSLKLLFDSNSITFTANDTQSTLKNYAISSYEGKLTIKKAQIVVDTTIDAVVYNGKDQSITFSPQVYSFNGNIADDVKSALITVLYNNNPSLPRNVGNYTVSYSISSSYVSNYTLVDSTGEVNSLTYGSRFTITQREIKIAMDTAYQKAYTGELISYELKQKDVQYTFDENTTGVVKGHTISGLLTTNGIDPNTYTYGDSTNYLTLDNFDISDGTNSVLPNYNIVSTNGTIIIVNAVAGEIDTEHLTSLVYNGTDYVASNDIYVSVILNGETKPTYIYYGKDNNGKGTLTNLKFIGASASSAILAGNYSVLLTITNSDTVDKQIDFTIAKKKIQTIEIQKDKIYDKTSVVVGTIISSDILTADKTTVEISGVYVDTMGHPTSYKGTHEIELSLSGSKSNNYELALDTISGEIKVLDIVVGLNEKYTTFYTGSKITLSKAMFNAKILASGEVIADFVENIVGDVEINEVNVGTYDLSLKDINSLIANTFASIATNSTYLDNYNIVAYSGTLQINKAQLVVDVSELNKIYNGLVLAPIFNASIKDSNGYISESDAQIVLTVLYNLESSTQKLSEVVNAGTYKINISISDALEDKYTFVDSLNSEISSYIYENNFVVNKRDISFKVADQQTYSYDSNKKPAVYVLKNTDFIDPTGGLGGLVSGQRISGTFTTKDYRGGTYILNNVPATSDFTNPDITITPSIKIFDGENDVSQNYNYGSYTITMVIYSSIADSFDTTNIDNLIYSKHDYVVDGEIKVSIIIDGDEHTFVYGQVSDIALMSELKYEGSAATSVIKAGTYSFVISISTNGASKNETISFVVAKKNITSIVFTKDKVYDGTADVLGTITTNDVCDYNGKDDLVITAKYADGQNAITTKGVHDVKFTLGGADSANYELAYANKGEILQREITIAIDSSYSIIYNGGTISILSQYMIVSEGTLAPSETFSGNVLILSKNVDSYSFDTTNVDISNLIVNTTLNANVTSNYVISLGGDFTISKKELEIDVAEIDLTYDAKVQSILTFLTFNNVANEIKEEAQNAISIAYDKTPIDAGDYVATISSSSNNLIFKISGQDSTTVDFNIKKRNISINLGTITKIYNPTSDYETLISNDYVTNIVEGQEIEGTYKLFEKGLNVGTYTYADGQIIFSGIAINVNGTNVIESNYNVESYDGTIIVKPYTIPTDEVYLVKTTFVYDTTNIYNYLQLKFKDANGVFQTISATDTTLGTITLVENDEAVNAGEYKVVAVIKNCEIATNEFTFTILQKEISKLNYNTDKNYDGTANVYSTIGTVNLSSSQTYSKDKIRIYGYYVEGDTQVSTVGTHNLKFVIENESLVPQKNYKISEQLNVTGEIKARTLTLTANNVVFGYNLLGTYILDYNAENFATVGDLVALQEITGRIEVQSLNTLGTIQLANNYVSTIKVVLDGTDVSSNYLITINGAIIVNKAQISLDFAGIESVYTYCATNIQITPLTVNISVTDENLPDITINYTGRDTTKYDSSTAPVNKGSYLVSFGLSNAEFYEIVGIKEFSFDIIAYTLTINNGDIPADKFFKLYMESDPIILSHTLTSEYNENINVEFTREIGEERGTYDIYVSTWDNENYNVAFAENANKDLFTIRKAGTLTVVIIDNDKNRAILTKVFDNSSCPEVDISTLDYSADGQVVVGTIKFASGVNVGSYAYESSILETDNFGNCVVDTTLEYVITVKQFVINSSSFEKIYNGSDEFVNELWLEDTNGVKLEKTTYPLAVNAIYTNKNVGANIVLELTFSGDNIANYEQVGSIAGSISKRHITITPTSEQKSVYGDEVPVITYNVEDNESSTFYGNIESEFTGTLKIVAENEKFNAGSYKILSEITASNFDITFTNNVYYVIEQKLLTVSAEPDFNKVFDGTSDVIAVLSLSGVIEGDDVSVSAKYYSKTLVENAEVGIEKVVVFTLSGTDAENYYTNNAVGEITDKFVNLVYNYLPENVEMINSDRMVDNTLTQSNIIYGQKVNKSISSLPIPSHEGYTFDGWYFDTAYTISLTNETIINEDVWDIDLVEKQVYAKWTIKSFNLLILSTTRVNQVYLLDADKQGGSLSSSGGSYSYYSVVSLNDIAVAKSGYEFLGFGLGITSYPDDTILENGIVIESKDNVVYAKFAPLTLTLTLDANGGMFERVYGWTYNVSLTVATISVEFNTSISLTTSIPSASRVGYRQDENKYLDGNTEITLNNDTILGNAFYPNKTLKVVYIAEEYKLILDSNGGYFETLTNGWIKEEEIDGNITKVSKTIPYDSEIGTIISPTRKGYTFISYDGIENLSSAYVWRFTSSKTCVASWSENIYTITVRSQHANVSAKIYNQLGDLISDYSSAESEQLVITMSTTNRLQLSLDVKKGWSFAKWTSDFALTNSEIQDIEINTIVENIELVANFTPRDNNITITTNTIKGYAYSGSSSTKLTGTVTFTSKTGTQAIISAIANEGYSVSRWTVICEDEFFLSGSDVDIERTLSNFVSDVEITITFAENVNEIKIEADNDKGSFDIDGEVEKVSSWSVYAKTESAVIFKVNSNHGYKVDTNLSSWSFTTTSFNKGNFVIETNDDIITITFTGFTNNGTITIPFIKENYTIKVVAITNDTYLKKNLTLQDMVNVYDNGEKQVLSSQDTFGGEYLKQFKLEANQVVAGYDFSSFSTRDNVEYSLTTLTGLVATYDDGSVDIKIVDNMTIYVVYTIKSFDLTFSVNSDVKGQLAYKAIQTNRLQQTIKYGYNAENVEALAFENYVFKKWVKVVGDKQVDVSTDAILSLQSISSNDEYIAVFSGKPIIFKVKASLLEQDILKDGEIDFAELVIKGSADVVVLGVTKRDTEIEYTISTLTGEKFDIEVVEKQGYEYSSLEIAPRFNYSVLGTHIIVDGLTQDESTMTIFVKAQIHTITFKLTGKRQGGDVFFASNTSSGESISLGVSEYQMIDNGKTLIVKVKTNGSAGALVRSYIGYSIEPNEYLSVPSIVTVGTISSNATGVVKNITSDKLIEIEISSMTYQITFNYNYDGVEDVVSVIDFGETTFNPAIDENVSNPERARYWFRGWNTSNIGTGRTYMFDEDGNIYYLDYVNGELVKYYGFYGTYDDEVATTSGIDYNSNLYAIWELKSFSVNVVIVPSFAVAEDNIDYKTLLPESNGRLIKYKADFSQEVESVNYYPDSVVKVVSPIAYKGFNYYGWSYESGITDKALVNIGEFSGIMPEEELIVYLYYTMTISTEIVGGGEATSSVSDALYGQSITLNAVAGSGYDFEKWFNGNNEIENSKETMTVIADRPTTYIAKFLGKIVDIRLANGTNGKLKVLTTSGETNVYRVGDLLALSVYDLTYGYFANQITGDYSKGSFSLDLTDKTKYYYTITPDDAVRGYASFNLETKAMQIYIDFVIADAVGGVFEFNGVQSVSSRRSYNYDDMTTFNILTFDRYEMTSLKVNDKEIDMALRQLYITKANGFIAEDGIANKIVATFKQQLWIETRQEFTGLGTSGDPYIISNVYQLSEMAYLINNKIEAVGKIPYADGYYVITGNMNLKDRFWQPIGTQDNPFNGTFNMKDYNFADIYPDKEYSVTMLNGLFGYVTDNAKFITSPSDFTVAIIIIASVGGVVLVALAVIVVIIVSKKKRMQKLSNAMTVAGNDIDKVISQATKEAKKIAKKHQKYQIPKVLKRKRVHKKN